MSHLKYYSSSVAISILVIFLLKCLFFLVSNLISKLFIYHVGLEEQVGGFSVTYIVLYGIFNILLITSILFISVYKVFRNRNWLDLVIGISMVLFLFTHLSRDLTSYLIKIIFQLESKASLIIYSFLAITTTILIIKEWIKKSNSCGRHVRE